MSYYLKRISVLKQIGTGFSMNGKALSGLAKIEKTGLNQSVVISLINAAPVSEGDYYAVLCGTDKKFSCLNIGKNPSTFSSSLSFIIEIEEGFACLICFVNQNKATNIAFGTSGLVNSGIEEMKMALLKNNIIFKAIKIENDKKEIIPDIVIKQTNSAETKLQPEPKKVIAVPPEPELLQSEELLPKLEKTYQDEIVVTDNYYLYNDVDINNLSIKGGNDEPKLIEDESIKYQDKENNEKEIHTDIPASNESFVNLFKDPSTFDFDQVTKGNYFDKVKSELDTIFDEHPKEDALEKNIPCSKWAKIFYSDEKYYTVGLIFDDKKPAYICYGVPGKYSKEPPSELKGFCSYLPLSIFDVKGDGYWMMYQNADSGECVQIDFL
jgi:hypothetical protein